jgi:hypothetical protein
VGSACGAPPITSPGPGSTLTSNAVAFTGGHTSCDLQHWLYVGTTQGGSNLFNADLGTGHTATVAGLPNSGTIWVRYWTLFSTGWVFTDQSYTMSVGAIFQDNMENGSGNWFAEVPWALTTATAHSATHSWTDSPGGNYGNDTNASLWSPTLNLSGRTSATLTFWHRYDLESSFDFARVWVTTDGGATFTQVASFTGTNTTWTQATINLNAFAGQSSVRILFQLFSDDSITRDGWYVDDVVVTGSP